MTIFSVLTSKVFAGIGAVLLLLLVASRLQIHSLHNQVGQLQGQLAVTQRDLAQARANAATLETAVNAQNLAVERERAAGATRIAELDRIASTARADAQNAQSRAAAILARPRTGNDCADASAAIEEAIR